MVTKKKKVSKKSSTKVSKKSSTKVSKKSSTKVKAVKIKKSKTTHTKSAHQPKKELTVKTSFSPVNRVRSKNQVYAELATATGLTKKQISNVFDNLASLIKYDLTKGPKVFQLPSLLKISVSRKPAVAARKGINPFTGEEMLFKAKPARNIVKAKALKALKDMV